MLQRLIDIAAAGVSLLLLSPLLLPLAIALRFSGEGEVFYRQRRIGKAEKEFWVYKFATMLKDSPNIGSGTVTVRDDPRILPMGHFLRKTKLNELPQLLNVLVGDMSLIGPRPLVPQGFYAYPERMRARIASVRPGLSGIGSVVFRSEEQMIHSADDKVDFYVRHISPYKGALEVWFVDHNSLATYLKLIFATVWVVLFPSSGIVWRLFPDIPRPPAELGALRPDGGLA